MTRETITAVISNRVAEKAVCWCDGRKKRSNFVIETRSEVQSYRNLKAVVLTDLFRPIAENYCAAGTYTLPADTRSTLGTSVESRMCCHPARFSGLARKLKKY